MKKALSFVGLLVLMASTALAATPTFEAHKWVTVTGDWEWDDGWHKGEFPTTTYEMDAVTYEAVDGNAYQEFENGGTPWEYELEAHVWMGDEGTIENNLHAWTLNDPETTPATGGYTQYEFQAHNWGEFTDSHLVVMGEGEVNVYSQHKADSFVQQDTYLKIN